MLVSAIHQQESAVSIHMSPPPWTSLAHPATFYPSLYMVTKEPENSHWLSVLCAVMFLFQRCSPSSSHPLLPLPCPPVCSLCLCFHCLHANRFIHTIFLDSLYVCVLIYICVSLSIGPFLNALMICRYLDVPPDSVTVVLLFSFSWEKLQ